MTVHPHITKCKSLRFWAPSPRDIWLTPAHITLSFSDSWIDRKYDTMDFQLLRWTCTGLILDIFLSHLQRSTFVWNRVRISKINEHPQGKPERLSYRKFLKLLAEILKTLWVGVNVATKTPINPSRVSSRATRVPTALSSSGPLGLFGPPGTHKTPGGKGCGP